MINPDSIVLIVPCYNEAHRLPLAAFNDCLETYPNISFVFVDDGSTDETLNILTGFCADTSERARIISLSVNSGKAEAVRQGMLKVIASGFAYLGYWDADLSTPLDEINNLLQSLNKYNADVVLGSRVKILGHEIERHLYRHLAGRVFATLASNVLNLPVYDTQCGAKIFSNNRYLEIAFADAFISGWSFDVEILMRYKMLYSLSDLDMNILEVPIHRWDDVAGSKVNPLDFFSASYDLLRIRSYYHRKSVIGRYREALLLH